MEQEGEELWFGKAVGLLFCFLNMGLYHPESECRTQTWVQGVNCPEDMITTEELLSDTRGRCHWRVWIRLADELDLETVRHFMQKPV